MKLQPARATDKPAAADRLADGDVWIVTDTHIGTRNQCLGLTDALGVAPRILLSDPAVPWRWLPPRLWPWPLAAQRGGGDRLAPPWPRLIVTSGRVAFAPAAAIRRRAAGRTVVVAIQHPRVPLDWFDLAIVPAHDRPVGANLLVTEGALNRVGPTALAAAAARFAPDFADLPRPLVAVLIGGSNARYRMTVASARALGRHLAVAGGGGAGLALTASRRTSSEALAALMAEIAHLPHRLWNGNGDNPYLGMLALADHLVVTEDSISMTSEALTTAKPVHVARLEGDGGKFARFQAAMADSGRTRPFTGALATWSYPPLADNDRAAAAVTTLLGDQPSRN
jgi:mitochondrial fission protein ELM1